MVDSSPSCLAPMIDTGLGSEPEAGTVLRMQSYFEGPEHSTNGDIKRKSEDREPSLESESTTDLMETLAPRRMVESTSWEHMGTRRVYSDIIGCPGSQHVEVREVKQQGTCSPRPHSGIQDSSARRMISTHDSHEPRSLNRGLFNRQWSHVSAGPDAIEARRRSSFSRQLRGFRGESQDSLASLASEPASYSNKLYLSSDIWLTEKKLDSVEGDIKKREEEKIRRRGKPRRDVHDVFGRESESQNFSSRLVGLLWSNPVTSNPAAPSRATAGKKDSHRRGRTERRRNGPERGALGADGKFAPKASCHLSDNMPGALPHVNSTGPSRESPAPTQDELEFIELQNRSQRQRGYYVKELARKADPVRWYRRHVMKRAERFDIY